MSPRLRCALLVAICLCSLRARGDEREVRMPLTDYEELRDSVRDKLRAAREPKPGVAVIDRLTLSGSFAHSDLLITLTGRATANAEPLNFMDDSLRLHACEGQGTVSKTTAGYLLKPIAPKFSVRCRVAKEQGDERSFTTTAAVLWLESTVTDGQMTVVDAPTGERGVTLSRRLPEMASSPVAVDAAHYRVTVLPDGTRFRYELQARNPNRHASPLTLELLSGEHVERVDAGAGVFEHGHWVFDLQPGASTIAVSGTLTGDAFTPPIEAGAQYLLVENDPLLRVDVKKAPKNISVPETGMGSDFRGAQAFLLNDRHTIGWSVTRVDALSAPTLSIRESTHTFFITRDGGVIGESRISLENQGSSDLSVPMQGRPLFASVQSTPVLLTTNADGQLWVPLTQGAQTLGLQFQDMLTARFGLAWGQLGLPRFDEPSTSGRVDIRYPNDWTPLYERFQASTRLHTPDRARLWWASFIAMAGAVSLLALGFSLARTTVLAVAMAGATLALDWAGWLVLVGALTVAAVWVVSRTRALGQGSVVLGAMCFLALLPLSAFHPTPTSRVDTSQRIVPPAPASMLAAMSSRWPKAESYPSRSCDGLDHDCNGSNDDGLSRSPTSGGYASVTQVPYGASTAASLPLLAEATTIYAGLPALTKIPDGSLTSSFSAEFISTAAECGPGVLLIRTQWLEAITILFRLFCLTLLFAHRRQVLTGVQRLFADSSFVLSPVQHS